MNSSITSGIVLKQKMIINAEFREYAEISSGVINVLYVAERYGKRFILKALKPEYREIEMYQQLLIKEFELGVQLSHPNIVNVQSFEEDSQLGMCIVMEYVDGETLAEFMKTKHPSSVYKKIVNEILDAMEYFHNRQIIHRDLKPENILITYNGNNVKIIDFGLSDTDYHTELKQPAGTQHYAAPEQMTSDMVIDCRADVYAFGRILKEIFPSRYAFPYSLVIKQCIQKDRNKRFSNVEAIREKIRMAYLWRNIFIWFLLAILVFVALRKVSMAYDKNMQKIVYSTDTLVMQVPMHDTSVSMPVEPVVDKKNVETAVSSETVTVKSPFPIEISKEHKALLLETKKNMQKPWKLLYDTVNSGKIQMYQEVLACKIYNITIQNSKYVTQVMRKLPEDCPYSSEFLATISMYVAGSYWTKIEDYRKNLPSLDAEIRNVKKELNDSLTMKEKNSKEQHLQHLEKIKAGIVYVK